MSWFILGLPVTTAVSADIFTPGGRYAACRLFGHERPVFGIAFTRGRDHLVSGCKGGVLNYWSWDGFLLFRTRRKSPVYFLSTGDRGRKLYVARGDGVLEIRNGRKLARRLKSHATNILSVQENPDRKTFVTTSEDRLVKLWKVGGEPLMTVEDHKQPVTTVGFHPGKMIYATGGRDNLIKISSRNGLVRKTLIGHTDYVWSVRFTPDGKYLLSCSKDKTIRIWDVATWKTVRIIRGHRSDVWALAVSANSRFIASGGRESEIYIWSFRGRLIRKLKGHRKGVISLLFSTDGKTLASGSLDGTVILWR